MSQMAQDPVWFDRDGDGYGQGVWGRLAPHLLMVAILGFFVWAGIWAHLTKIDEVTRGTGQVIPSQEIQVVASLEGGILAELLVSEGTQVEQGQVLARIDPVQFAAEQRGSQARLLGLEAAIARLQAEASGAALTFPEAVLRDRPEFAEAERALYDNRSSELADGLAVIDEEAQQIRFQIAETNARISQLTRDAELVQEELSITEQLVSDGVVAEIEAIRLRQRLNEATGGRSQAREELSRLRASLSTNEERRAERISAFRAEAREDLNARQVERATQIERMASIDDRVARTALRAPVAGEIVQITVKTLGGIIQPGQPLIEIVPREDDLKIRARIRPADIAFLSPGQEVRVKITAYDFAIYGSLDGQLERISADTVLGPDDERYYEIEVRTTENRLEGRTPGEVLPIIPGMVAEVDVLTGRRSILDYLLKPLTRIKDRALRER